MDFDYCSNSHRPIYIFLCLITFSLPPPILKCKETTSSSSRWLLHPVVHLFSVVPAPLVVLSHSPVMVVIKRQSRNQICFTRGTIARLRQNHCDSRARRNVVPDTVKVTKRRGRMQQWLLWQCSMEPSVLTPKTRQGNWPICVPGFCSLVTINAGTGI